MVVQGATRWMTQGGLTTMGVSVGWGVGDFSVLTILFASKWRGRARHHVQRPVYSSKYGDNYCSIDQGCHWRLKNPLLGVPLEKVRDLQEYVPGYFH